MYGTVHPALFLVRWRTNLGNDRTPVHTSRGIFQGAANDPAHRQGAAPMPEQRPGEFTPRGQAHAPVTTHARRRIVGGRRPFACPRAAAGGREPRRRVCPDIQRPPADPRHVGWGLAPAVGGASHLSPEGVGGHRGGAPYTKIGWRVGIDISPEGEVLSPRGESTQRRAQRGAGPMHFRLRRKHIGPAPSETSPFYGGQHLDVGGRGRRAKFGDRTPLAPAVTA